MPKTKRRVFKRDDGRNPDDLRPVKFKKGVAPAALSSVLIRMGNTQVICAVSIEESVPRWMKIQKVEGGWVTAEYSMLPYANPERSRREVTAGKVNGRTQEIQRLIGRSLRAAVDLKLLGSRTLWIDCDVLQADGGTRTASITGTFAALHMAINKLLKQGILTSNPIREPVAAISVGLVDGIPLLDLCYTEDVAAEVDMNIVITGSGKLVEVQGTAEDQPFSKAQFNRMMKLAEKGIKELVEAQQTVSHV
ncbi:MAG: ribonuclease PH [Kiritimatiellae bacterium]|nr:ribonuclease PH [Kiritimatiellia bacterium]